MAFKVFNPQTGLYTHCETEAEAKAVLVGFVRDMYTQTRPGVLRKFINDKGDYVWVDTAVDESITFS